MSKELRYALNLSSAAFLGPLGQAATGLAGFVGLTLSAGAAIDRVFGEVKRGAGLNDLSARTGESVSNLVRLQHAFNQGGVSAESLRNVTFNLQRSLSGVSETGDATVSAFRALGTSAEALRNLSTPDALLRVFEGVNKLSAADAAGAVGKIFGRGAAGEVLQLARDTESFKRSLTEAAAQGALMQRMASAFDKLDDTIGSIKFKFGGLFTGLAAGLTPALQALADLANQIDFEGIGNEIGRVFSAATEAFKDGQFAEFLTMGLEAAAEQFGNVMIATFDAIGVFALTRIGQIFQSLPDIFVIAFKAKLGEVSLLLAELFNFLGQDKVAGKLALFSANQLGAAQKGLRDFIVGDIDQLKAAADEARAAFQEGMGAFGNEKLDAFKAKLEELQAKVEGAPGDSPKPKGGGLGGPGLRLGGSSDALTRLGFFANSTFGVQDHGADIARHTRETVVLLKEINRKPTQPTLKNR